MSISLNASDLDKFLQYGLLTCAYLIVKWLLRLSNAAKAVKPSVSEKNAKGAPVKNGRSSSSSANVGQFVEEILQKTSELLLSQINEGNIKQHGEQLGTVVSDNLRNNLSTDLKNLADKYLVMPN
ncbi:hypothetical protein PIB30_078108 [Stylosanthes scabra]|uniref:Uncharacterized protein n=1 Tax=Stylosanthes scabra TaxID=79078 RepID=A0ABU6WQK0_9FABA|nr:hypothetical protein [Stylosanthes scabra]